MNPRTLHRPAAPWIAPAAAGAALGAGSVLAAFPAPVPGANAGGSAAAFERIRLTDTYYSEGAGMGDIDRDGHIDVVAGPFWYAGPDFERRAEICPPVAQDTQRYADNFFAFVYDFRGDGWPDVFMVGFPGTPGAWYENPRGAGGHWARHEVADWVSNESPHFTDLVGDVRPELVCTRDGHYGYYTFDPAAPERPWIFHPVSEERAHKRFGHGLGVGDIDGDGRADVIAHNGWMSQPASLDGDPVWAFHPQEFTRWGGAQMFAYDVDGDGDADVITSLAAHGHGLAWYEQFEREGKPAFRQHRIMGSRPAENRYGVVFSELHALALADIDGDGLKDIVTGRTYWSHHTRTPGWHDGAVVYWFRLVRGGAAGVDFVPYEADDDSGFGRLVTVGDLNGDGRPDTVTANMKGTTVLLQPGGVGRVPPPPKPYVAPSEPPPAGVLPAGAGGRALNLDFEKGTLEDWTATGDAFRGQPVRGEIDPARKWGKGKTAGPQGDFWVGGFEVTIDDAPVGTLTSAPFEVTHPYASLRIGGGYHQEIRMELVDRETGRPVYVTHGRASERMTPEVIDLSAVRGRVVFIRLVDEHKGGFGHLNFDDFRFHEELPVFPDAVNMTRRAALAAR